MLEPLKIEFASEHTKLDIIFLKPDLVVPVHADLMHPLFGL